MLCSQNAINNANTNEQKKVNEGDDDVDGDSNRSVHVHTITAHYTAIMTFEREMQQRK